MRIFLIGPQGSGKSTQSKLLAEYLNLPFIETGEIFRELSTKESELGKKVGALLQAGEFIPDDLTTELIKNKLGDAGYEQGFVMNGYPRNLNQLKKFDPGFDKVFYLKVSDDEVIKRLLERAREDDTKELIEKRLADYHQLTEPILEYFKNSGILEEIDGARSIEKIQQDLRSRLNG